MSSADGPVAGIELMIADDDGNELARGAIGELWHRHRGVINGYLDNPEATASESAEG